MRARWWKPIGKCSSNNGKGSGQSSRNKLHQTWSASFSASLYLRFRSWFRFRAPLPAFQSYPSLLSIVLARSLCVAGLTASSTHISSLRFSISSLHTHTLGTFEIRHIWRPKHFALPCAEHTAPEAEVGLILVSNQNSRRRWTFRANATRKCKFKKNLQREPILVLIYTKNLFSTF